jgi:hypothetical protein
MALTTRTRTAATAAVVTLAAAALTAAGVATAQNSSAAVSCGSLFDDFSYSSRTDPALGANGWSVRTESGGPGVPGARWSADNITFPTSDGQKVAQLTGTTNGTGSGTTQAEFLTRDRKFMEGTYLARVKFADAPVSGSDGDHINETFFTISPLAAPMDPTYSELDFSEYLPNGGWGGSGPTNYETTWYTYQADPWVADNQSSQQTRSLAGWHDVMATVGDGHVKYYIDGALVGDHSGKYYPRQNMVLEFNQWFIDTAGHSGGTSTWQEQVDYVYHAKKQVLTPAQVSAQVSAYRSSGVSHADTVTADNGCTPSGTPTPPTPPTGNNRLSAGQRLSGGQGLTSPNGRFHLNMQTDGNLVIYDGTSPIWSTGTWNLPADRKPTRAEMQADGNLVLYSAANQAAWASASWGSGRVSPYLLMQDDGNAVIYHNGQAPIWSSGTAR